MVTTVNGLTKLIRTQVPGVAGGAYAAGDFVGTKITLANAARGGFFSGYIDTVVLTCKTSINGPFDIVFFDTDLAVTTVTDNGAKTLDDADVGKVVGVAHCNDVTVLGTGGSGASIHQAVNLGIPFFLPAWGTSLYAFIVVGFAPTIAASDLDLTVSIRQD